MPMLSSSAILSHHAYAGAPALDGLRGAGRYGGWRVGLFVDGDSSAVHGLRGAGRLVRKLDLPTRVVLGRPRSLHPHLQCRVCGPRCNGRRLAGRRVPMAPRRADDLRFCCAAERPVCHCFRAVRDTSPHRHSHCSRAVAHRERHLRHLSAPGRRDGMEGRCYNAASAGVVVCGSQVTPSPTADGVDRSKRSKGYAERV